jgi:phasin family protein
MRKNPPRTPGAPLRAHAPLASTASPEGWVGMTRDQLEFALQSATTWLRGAEAVRKVQWDMTHLALQRFEDMQHRAHEANDLSELIALQVEMMRFDVAASIKSAQELYDVAVHNATDTLVGAKSTFDATQNDGLKSWLQSMQSMMHTGVRPLDDMFSNSVLRDLMKMPGVDPAKPKATS